MPLPSDKLTDDEKRMLRILLEVSGMGGWEEEEEEDEEQDLCPACNRVVLPRTALEGPDGSLLCPHCNVCVVQQCTVSDTQNGNLAFLEGGCYNEAKRAMWDWRLRRDRGIRYSTYQPYQRVYHLNERFKSRNNTDPRIPSADLAQMSRLFLREFPEASALPDVVNRDTVALALKKRPDYSKYVERWLQFRYWLVTGLQHNDAEVEYDIPLITNGQEHIIRERFREFERAFDRLLYRSSVRAERRTPKDDKWGRPDDRFRLMARHNMVQYNAVFHVLILLCFGPSEYTRLRTEYCFPLPQQQQHPLRTDRGAGLHGLNGLMHILMLNMGDKQIVSISPPEPVELSRSKPVVVLGPDSCCSADDEPGGAAPNAGDAGALGGVGHHFGSDRHHCGLELCAGDPRLGWPTLGEPGCPVWAVDLDGFRGVQPPIKHEGL